MNIDIHDIDKLFKDSIEPLEGKRSALVWNNLDARLNKEDAHRYKKRFFIYRRITAALMLLVFAGIGFEIIQHHRFGNIHQKSVIVYSLAGVNKHVIGNATLKHTAKDTHNGVLTGHDPVNFKSITPPIQMPPRKQNPLSLTTGWNQDAGSMEGIKESMSYTIGNPLAYNARTVFAYIDNPTATIRSTSVSGNLKQLDRFSIAAKRVAQKKPAPPFKPYWTISAVAAPEWTAYSLEDDVKDNRGGVHDDKAAIRDRENHEPSFSASILVARQLSPHWAIQTGFTYFKTSISIDPQTIYASQQPGGAVAYKYYISSGYAYVTPGFGQTPVAGDSLVATNAQHNLQYLNIPLGMQYWITTGRFSIGTGMAVMANFLLSAKLETVVTDAQNAERVIIHRLDGTKSFYAGLQLSTVAEYKLNNHWSVGVLPVFRTALTAVTRSNVVRTYPYSFGVNAGIMYRL